MSNILYNFVMEDFEVFTREEARLKEKQAKCLHHYNKDDCLHPSYVCLLCGHHQDNEQARTLVDLEEKLSAFELLTGINRK